MQNYSFFFSKTSILTFFYDKCCYFVYFDMWTLQKSMVIEVVEVGITSTGGIDSDDCSCESADHLG